MGKGASIPSIDKHGIATQEPERPKGGTRTGKMNAAEFALKTVAAGTDFISGARERTTQILTEIQVYERPRLLSP